ncbi:hypothetical protein JX266_012713 [Neoarthrinium moseri]|nr:hypothetical protein JX266_012713 [Neoarthrinium moseri]
MLPVEIFPLLFNYLSLCVAAVEPPRESSKRQLPADPTGVTTITSPNGFQIRYSEPGKSGVCETTPDVNSYSGYIDIDEKTHMFFWFFEARHNANEAPITLWLEGGPGADSLFGLFDLVGPCHVTEDLKSELNPNSFTEVSNVLFLSQPIGVGFSYADEVAGIINGTSGYPQNSSTPDGRYANVSPFQTTTTSAAAVTAWEVLQAFFQELPSFDPDVKSRDFNLWTLSYGGHWGPAFFEHFYEQNELIKNGKAQGVALHMQSLGIINGIIDIQVQMPYYPEYAIKNEYSIQLVNETVYAFMKMAFSITGGCSDSLDYCYASDTSTLIGQYLCASANAICRTMVEGPAESISNRSPYDIRALATEELEPSFWIDYVNTAFVQNALGVNLNYTSASSEQVSEGFVLSGDWAYSKLSDLEELLDRGVKVALINGDADYLANWMGGEAISLAANYTHSAGFRAANYEPLVVDGTKYGETREFGQFSFTKVYEAGHDVPFYQPVATLELFKRVLGNLVISDGSSKVDY